MKIYLATGNKNKKREMAQILESHTVVIPSDEGIDFDPVENGTTFYENSLLKARALYELVHCPVVADDSGICVDALGGAPGIYSARYGGPSFPHGKPDGSRIPQNEQNKFLVDQLNDALAEGVDSSRFLNGPRSAHYTCAMVLYLGGDRLYVAEETMEGTIVSTPADAAGTTGFGYDPLFFLPQYGRTAAQLSDDEKNAVS
ncbi:MAG TPA: non-canonical purine NTP pyrophosphatase, partial [Treponema sp.]|nr:non-canonical purine NTP pyrophosphatase [Treponema sp.]